MKIDLDSTTLPAATRRDTWRGMLCDTYMGVDCRLPESFRSVIQGHAIGQHTFTRIISSRHTVDRSPTLIKRDGLELVFFGVPLAGRAITIQGGREAVLERGALTVHDSSRPFLTFVEASADIVWLSVPKASIAERIALDFMMGIGAALARDPLTPDIEQLITKILDLLAKTIMADESWPDSSTHLMPRAPIH